MDGLMAALVAALLTQATDRSGWAAALLGDRHGRPGATALAGLIVVAATSALAAVAGSLMAPLLNPNAKALLLALALALAGIGALLPSKPPKTYVTTGGGAFVGSLAGFAMLALSDRAAFLTLALAARSPWPALAAVGATIGGAVVLAGYAAAGDAGRRRLPMAAIRVGTGILFLAAGAIAAASALRLI